MGDPSSFSGVPSVQYGPSPGRCRDKRRCRWYSSAQWSRLISPQTVCCRSKKSLCCMTQPAARPSQLFTYAMSRMFWEGSPWCLASWKEAVTIQFHILTVVVMTWRELELTQGKEQAMVASYMRWISGCGATAEVSQEKCQWLRPYLAGNGAMQKAEKSSGDFEKEKSCKEGGNSKIRTWWSLKTIQVWVGTYVNNRTLIGHV